MEETPGHILWSCLLAQDVWLEHNIKIQKCSISDTDFPLLLGNLLRKMKEGEMQLFAAMAQQIWFRRNHVVYGGKMCNNSHGQINYLVIDLIVRLPALSLAEQDFGITHFSL
jgi:hypothetical protein